ncbi:hypothetical protein BT69DRAFT_1282547 [Atractiella rhizophila]|nr:hypothetical protein BT69DRAFT_1282547 [Atractiella rhizophila]
MEGQRASSPVTLPAIALLPLQSHPTSALLDPPSLLTYLRCRGYEARGQLEGSRKRRPAAPVSVPPSDLSHFP